MTRRAGVLAALTLLGAVAAADDGPPPAPYQPLFTDAMIANAAPEQRERMRAAEEDNRRAYERRREANEAAAAPAVTAPAREVRTPRSRIYRWVDEAGRVHFGDAPTGKGAQEITVRGAAASPPPPAPPVRGSVPRGEAAPEPARDEGARDSRRGS